MFGELHLLLRRAGRERPGEEGARDSVAATTPCLSSEDGEISEEREGGRVRERDI